MKITKQDDVLKIRVHLKKVIILPGEDNKLHPTYALSTIDGKKFRFCVLDKYADGTDLLLANENDELLLTLFAQKNYCIPGDVYTFMLKKVENLSHPLKDILEDLSSLVSEK